MQNPTDITLSLTPGIFGKQSKLNTMQVETTTQTFISAEAMLEHWQGHRRLTRRVIEAFPEKEFIDYSIGGMRPFAELAAEMIGMAQPGIIGVATRKWPSFNEVDGEQQAKISSKKQALEAWDKVTDFINKTWPTIPSERFDENDLAFGMYEGKIYWLIQYLVDNEIHHRGQGYVYLRSLGIEPPAFWDRS